MPPLPPVRISPRRELKTENHKRGRSLESGILYREKDDDLALFNEVQNKESDNFLLQANHDFDDIFATKFRGFSNHKLGISIPARGESSDLLNAEVDKNDYDWLITPPETPLFSSLDDETPPINLATRGRPRSQPSSISRSPTMEKGNRSARASASPHRLSPSPKSSNSTLQSRSRPFSSTHSSPAPISRNSPSRGLSPPPSKPKPGPRSSTPTPGRMSTSSTDSRVRGPSPTRKSRGNSASPKLRAWQTNIPGFSSEAPPNLRTSLADRPASYVRGSSSASRNGSRTGRHSMSPTPSRSVSLSHSHERDPFSSISKGSVASSGDDDVDSLQSIPISTCDSSAPRSGGAFSNSRVVGFSKKPIKALSSSAPKRSFDLALRQMERERKSPQNMSRPLLSSVPSSTFYAGNAASNYRSLTSINSSITTSSNASSDRGTSGAHDTEESEQNHEDVTSNSVMVQYPDEIFVMDQSDALSQDVANRLITKSTFREADVLSEADAAVVISDRNFDCTDASGAPDLLLCSNCGGTFPPGELVMEGVLQVCLECKGVEINTAVVTPLKHVMEDKNIEAESVQVLEHDPLKILVGSSPIQEPFNLTGISETKTDHLLNIADNLCSEPSPNLDISSHNHQKVDVESGEQQLENVRVSSNSIVDNGESSNSKIDISEGAGISLLLKRSNSGKRHIVQSRSFTASNISYDCFSYATDSVNSMRTSFGQSSASVSSSIDLGPSRQTSAYMQRQLSGIKSDTDNYRFEMPTKHRRSSSSLSGSSSHVFQATNAVDPHEPSVPSSEFTEAESMCTNVENNGILKTAAEVQSDLANANYGGTDKISVLASEEPDSHENDGDLKDDSTNSMVVETLDAISEMDIENPDMVNADSLSDVGSSSSNSSMDEIEKNTALEGHNDDATATVGEIDVSEPVHVCEESTVVLEDLGGAKSKSLTLDEATDTILFCSSIVHNLAYEAANIAIDKENSPIEVLRPTITIPVLGKSVPERRDMRSKRRNSKSNKARQRKLETDSKPTPVIGETDEKPTQRIVGTPNKADSLKPPKLESKCNCTIM